MAPPCAAPPPQPIFFAPQARERRRLPLRSVLVAASSAATTFPDSRPRTDSSSLPSSTTCNVGAKSESRRFWRLGGRLAFCSPAVVVLRVRAQAHRVRAALSSSSATPKPTTEPREPTSEVRDIDLGLGGDPRGRPLGANPSTRPSQQPARRAWVAGPASGHAGRLCGIEEPGEVLLASSRRPGGSWSVSRAPIISR